MTTGIEFQGGSLDGTTVDTLPGDTVAVITVRKIGDGLYAELALARGADRDAVENVVFTLLLQNAAPKEHQ